jgi:hypothetical protein
LPRADDATAPVCFRLAKAAPAAAPPGPLRLGATPAEALAELLQVFACGEESASLAFARLGRSPLEETARRALAGIAGEEREHERLLRGLRGALPALPRDRALQRELLHFYHGLAQPEIGLHLASIASLDAAVCSILAALLHPAGILANVPAVAMIFRRIHRDEARHVRVARRLAAALVRKDVLDAVAARTRLDLVGLLAPRAAALERVQIDAGRLLARLGRVPDGLFA